MATSFAASTPASTSSPQQQPPPQQQPEVARQPDDEASKKGAVARALAATGSSLARIGGTVFRVPLKAFRQNKYGFAEGHLPLPGSAPAAAVAASSPSSKSHAKKSSPVKELMLQQGRAPFLLKQVVPSLVANVAVGGLMFATFDRVIVGLARAKQREDVPAWMCSTGLSTGYVCDEDSPQHQQHEPPSAAALYASALRPYIGPDVLLAGMLAGAAQSPVATPMENAAAWLRVNYRLMEVQPHHAHHPHTVVNPARAAAAAMSAASPSVTTAAVESTAATLLPPFPPRDLKNLNIYSAMRTMAPSTLGRGTQSSSGVAGAPSLFSNGWLRLGRDALSLGAFFLVFEALHGQLRRVPYIYLEHQSDKRRAARAAAAAVAAAQVRADADPASTITVASTDPAVSSSSRSSSSSPSPSLLAGLLAWDCLSVLSAGMAAGSACHLLAHPFNTALQRVESEQLRRLLGGPSAASAPAVNSAWHYLLDLRRQYGFRGLMRGAWGGPVAGEPTIGLPRAHSVPHGPRLLNPLTIGLAVFTLSKTEHHTHQLQHWRAERRRRKQEQREGVQQFQHRHQHVQ